MDLRRITPDFAVAPQLAPQDMAAAAAAGYRTVLNNRPDLEVEPGGPRSKAMEAAASEAGLAYRYLPFVPGEMTPELVAAFAQALAECPGPVLAYCRSGTRSSNLWAMASAGSAAPDELIARAAAAGYDLSQLRPALAARAAATQG